MPIYEFYCIHCHKVFSFFSKTINTHKCPPCPQCSKINLKRCVSRFAISSPSGDKDHENKDLLSNLDESKFETALASLAAEAESIDEDNPKAIAKLMRKLYDATGMEAGDGMNQALSRLESGENPESIEEEMGDLLESEEPFLLNVKKGQIKTARSQPPAVDETLYSL